FKVIEENIGGAALKSGETTRGAFKNMLAALSRVGVSLTAGFFPLIREGFVGMTEVFDAIGPTLEEIFSPRWEILQPLFSSAISEMSGSPSDWLTNLDVSGIAAFFEEGARGVLAFVEAWEVNDGKVTSSGFPGFMEQAAYFVRQLWDEIKKLDFSSFEGFKESIGAMDIDLSGLSGIGSGIGPVIKSVADSFLLIAKTS